MAEARGGQPDQRLAFLRRVQLDLLDAPARPRPRLPEERPLGLHGSSLFCRGFEAGNVTGGTGSRGRRCSADRDGSPRRTRGSFLLRPSSGTAGPGPPLPSLVLPDRPLDVLDLEELAEPVVAHLAADPAELEPAPRPL